MFPDSLSTCFDKIKNKKLYVQQIVYYYVDGYFLNVIWQKKERIREICDIFEFCTLYIYI